VFARGRPNVHDVITEARMVSFVVFDHNYRIAEPLEAPQSRD
jgi:hypothetical protein